MRIEDFGAGLIGSVLFAVGIAVLASNIDPTILCFKQCNLPKALSSVIGQEPLRVATGLVFCVLGLLFIVPLVTRLRSKKSE